MTANPRRARMLAASLVAMAALSACGTPDEVTTDAATPNHSTPSSSATRFPGVPTGKAERMVDRVYDQLGVGRMSTSVPSRDLWSAGLRACGYHTAYGADASAVADKVAADYNMPTVVAAIVVGSARHELCREDWPPTP